MPALLIQKHWPLLQKFNQYRLFANEIPLSNQGNFY